MRMKDVVEAALAENLETDAENFVAALKYDYENFRKYKKNMKKIYRR